MQLTYFTFNPLADAFVQSILQMRRAVKQSGAVASPSQSSTLILLKKCTEGVRLVCEVFQADIVLHFSLRRTALQYETDSAPALQSAITHHQRESTRPSHFEPTQNPVLFKLSYFQSLQRCFVSRVCNGSICLLSGLYIFIMRAERNLAIKLCINQLELRQIHIWLLLGLRLK